LNFHPNKIKASILLLPSLAPVIYYSIFLIAQFEARLEMKKELNKKQLTSIHIDKQTPVIGHEVYIDGKLFDIKNIRPLENGDLIAEGLFDEEESKLNDGLSENEENDQSETQLAKVIFQWQDSPPALPAFFYQSLSIIYDAPVDQRLHGDPFSFINTPPPQC
jgi:hypothetical protein